MASMSGARAESTGTTLSGRVPNEIALFANECPLARPLHEDAAFPVRSEHKIVACIVKCICERVGYLTWQEVVESSTGGFMLIGHGIICVAVKPPWAYGRAMLFGVAQIPCY